MHLCRVFNRVVITLRIIRRIITEESVTHPRQKVTFTHVQVMHVQLTHMQKYTQWIIGY